MTKKTQPRSDRRQVGTQQSGSKRWRTSVLMLVCGLMLVSGFFFAGRQHFSSMDHGMKNSRLRKQIDELEAEKRRLLLAREVSLSPAEIKKAATKSGMLDQAEAKAELAQISTGAREKMVPAQASSTGDPLVVRTAAVSAVQPTITEAFSRSDKVVKQIKKALTAE